MFISCSTIGGIKSASSSEKFLADQISTLEQVHDAGYEHVELYYNKQPEWVGKSIIQTIENLDLNPYSIHLPKFLVLYERDEFESLVSAVYPYAESLGIQVAVLHPPNAEQFSDAEWPWQLETLLDLSEKSGCTLTIENVPYLKGVDRFIRTQIDENEGRPLGATIDLEFMYVNGSEIQNLPNLFGNLILNIHFRDSDGELVGEDGMRRYLLPGTGEIDLHSVVQSLHRAGYNKALTVEVSHKQEQNIVKAKRYAEACVKRLE